MIKACLFDLDGTLLNTITTISNFGNYALSKFGMEPIDTKEYNYFVGDGAKKLVERMLKFQNAYSEENFCNVYRCYMDAYDANPTYLTEPYEGILDMLCTLKGKGIKIGVISNKPDYATKSVCENKFKKGLLDFVRGQVEGVPVKPNPKGPMEVLKALGVTSTETLYIGDSGVDMQTGKNLGCYTLGVSWGFRTVEELKENGANGIVYSPLEIIEIAAETDNL